MNCTAQRDADRGSSRLDAPCSPAIAVSGRIFSSATVSVAAELVSAAELVCSEYPELAHLPYRRWDPSAARSPIDANAAPCGGRARP